MTSIYDELQAAEPKRDTFGRYLIVPAAGGKAVAHTRATTVAETLDDRWALELWKMRQVALGLAARHDLLAQVAAHTADDKKVLNAVCKQAMDAAAAQSGANLGTALHKVIERYNRGEITPENVPPMFEERIQAFEQAAESLVLRCDLIERVAVLSKHKIAGMFDMGVEVDGKLYVADLKTGSGIDFGARGFAVQLSIYANADSLYNYATDTHEAAPGFKTDKALIIHLPAKGGPCELHWLDIAAGAEALEHAMWTRKWRQHKKLLTPFEQTPPATGAGSIVPSPNPYQKPPATKPARIEPVATPPEFTVDEGDMVANGSADATSAIKKRLSKELIDTLSVWVKDGDAGRRPWRLSALESHRRFTLYRGATRLIELCDGDGDPFAEDIARQIISLVIDEDVQPAVRIGVALGAMTIAEAERLVEVTDTFIKHGLTFADDGRPTLAVVA